MPKMGKASKWIRNFLLGKKEDKDKDKKRVSLVSVAAESSLGSPEAILSATKEKRRWNFKKSTAAEKITRRNASFDSISSAHLVKQVLEEHEIEQIRIKAVLIKSSTETNGRKPVVTTPVTHTIRPLKDSDAAIKIQAAFRSYLARKALCALRGLVKLQALVRGHQVRKQTTAVLRSMHALMTIQVRARYKRVQMVEAGKEFANKRTELPRNSTDGKHVNGHEPRTNMKSKSGPLDTHPHTEERREIGFITTYHSGRFLITKQEDQPDQICWTPSTILTEVSTQNSTLQNSSSNLSKTNQTKLPASNVPLVLPYENPSYMSDTESSKARARSQSEPKQRPKKWRPKQKSRRSTSMAGVNVSIHEQENQNPWLIKLYRSAKQVKNGDIDHSSATGCNSNCKKSLNEFEPPVKLY